MKTKRKYLQAPFPWFGGKSRVAHIVWQFFGDVPNFVEPFFGSGAVLLRRPHWPWKRGSHRHYETINDLDGCVTNFWRSIQHDPEQTAYWADNPIHELDLHARHRWLHKRLKSTKELDAEAKKYVESKKVLPFAAWLATNPDVFDPKVAGWWAWGLSSWIGDDWCRPNPQSSKPKLMNMGVHKTRPNIHRASGCRSEKANGLNRKLPVFRRGGQRKRGDGLIQWFETLSERLRYVDVCCGDWERICGHSPTEKRSKPCGVFLDPPYSQDAGVSTVYGNLHSSSISTRVREWCINRGESSDMRIALCGYEGEHQMPDGWTCIAWKATGGYGNLSHKHDNPNAKRERIWFSPYCLKQNEGFFNL